MYMVILSSYHIPSGDFGLVTLMSELEMKKGLKDKGGIQVHILYTMWLS